MWRNWLPHVNQVSDEESYDSVVEEEEDLNALVSPRRPPQSPSVSPRRLIAPDPPPVEEVLASAARSLRNLPNNPHREALLEQQRAAAAAAQAAIMPEQQIVAFEDENGVDENRALQEACRNVERVEWDDNDVAFFFAKVEIKMSAVGVKKQYTKFQVLSTTLPKKVEDQVKPLLIKTETQFPENNAYKILKTEVLRIFGPKPERAVDRALSRVLIDTPSELARALVNDLCKKQLKDCECCPAIISSLWKRQLSAQVRAGIAHCQFNYNTFNEVCQLADDIHSTVRPGGAVAAVAVAAVSLDETQPAIPYAAPEVAAIGRGGRGGRGRGRGYRGNRGNRGGGNSNSNQSESSSSGTSRFSGTKHPDLPAGEWKGCRMHHRWGRGAHFCSEPSTCPWKDIYTAKPTK